MGRSSPFENLQESIHCQNKSLLLRGSLPHALPAAKKSLRKNRGLMGSDYLIAGSHQPLNLARKLLLPG